MDTIFKALNDPARRKILDSLRAQDGQTLSELETQFSTSRFAVMKHLKILEEANLIITRKSGRFKYHYLNALPLQEMVDRWVEPLLARPMAEAISQMKSNLERTSKMKPDFVHQTIIRTTPKQLWDALLKGDMTRRYYFDTTIEGQAEPGEMLVWRGGDGKAVLSAKVIEVEPFKQLNMTFEPHFIPGAPASRHVFLIEEMPGACRLTVEHYDLPEGMQGIRDGWVLVFSRLKTFLETGDELNVTMQMMSA